MIIDSHIHYGYLPGYRNYGLSIESLIDLMDRLGIKYSININALDLGAGDLEGGAEEDIRLFDKSNGRILSHLVYDPRKADRCLGVIDKYYDNRIFKGVKLHPSLHLTDAVDDRYERVFEYAAKNDIIIISHTWDKSLTNPVQQYSFPAKFEKHIIKYPEVRFICAHSGGRYDGILEAARLARTYDNVYLDIAGDIYANGFIEYISKNAGSKKILFGSDCSMMDQRTMLGVVLGSGIGIKDKEDILFNNASELFGIS